jgi:hypothetical protein
VQLLHVVAALLRARQQVYRIRAQVDYRSAFDSNVADNVARRESVGQVPDGDGCAAVRRRQILTPQRRSFRPGVVVSVESIDLSFIVAT